MNTYGSNLIYSNADDMMPSNAHVITSQYVRVQPNIPIQTVSDFTQVTYKLPQFGTGTYDLKSHYFVGQLSVFPRNIEPFNSQVVCCLEQALMAGLFNYDLEIGSTSLQSYRSPRDIQPLAQAYWMILSNTHGRPYGEANMTFNGVPQFQSQFQYARKDGELPTVDPPVYPVEQDQFVDSTAPIYGVQVFSLKVNSPCETNFADLCLDIDQSEVVSVPRSGGLQNYENWAIDGGILYRIRLLKKSNPIDFLPTPPGVPQQFTPVINFIGHAPCPYLDNPYQIQGNISIEFKLTKNPGTFSIMGDSNFETRLNRMDLYVKQNILAAPALEAIASEPMKIYDFFGVSCAAFPMTSQNIQITADFAPRSPSLLVISFIRQSLLNGAIPPADTLNLKSWLRNGFDQYEAVSPSDNTKSRRFLVNTLQVEFNGLQYPQSAPLSETNDTSLPGINQTLNGETSYSQAFKMAMRRPELLGYETIAHNLGATAIDLVANDGTGFWYDTKQKVERVHPTINISVVSQPDSDLVPLNQYSVLVVAFYNRELAIQNNSTVAVTAA
jgi:hypothetical protein